MQALRRVLVRILRMDPVAGEEFAHDTGPADRQMPTRLQMHLDARVRSVKQRNVAPLANVEVAAEYSVHIAKHVQIERRRHAKRIVIGEFEQASILHKVEAEQQVSVIAARRARALQEGKG